MLSLFSFAGRIGRLSYFLGSLALAVVMGGLAVVTMGAAFVIAGSRGGIGLIVVAIGALAIASTWATLALQVRRFRDMGWDPFVAIVGWFAVGAADAVAAHLLPSLAIGRHHHGTAFGAVLNLAVLAALLFWPGRGDDVDLPRAPSDPAPQPRFNFGPTEREPILVRTVPEPGRKEFGRRRPA